MNPAIKAKGLLAQADNNGVALHSTKTTYLIILKSKFFRKYQLQKWKMKTRKKYNERSMVLRDIKNSYSTISGRKKEVMSLVIPELINKQIAGCLNLSFISIKLHKNHVIKNEDMLFCHFNSV